jgi:hypothetical protein
LDGSSNGKLDPFGIVRVLRDHEGNFLSSLILQSIKKSNVVEILAIRKVSIDCSYALDRN